MQAKTKENSASIDVAKTHGGARPSNPRSESEEVLAAARKIVEEKGWKTIDDVSRNRTLASLLGVPQKERHKIPALAHALITHGALSATIPELYWPTEKTRFLDPAAVTTEVALSNARKLMQSRYLDVSQVPMKSRVIKQIVSLLGKTENTSDEQRTALHELAWGTPFRVGAETKLPSQFQYADELSEPKLASNTNKKLEKQLLEKGAGSFFAQKNEDILTFVKGQAFEQVVGILLQLKDSNEVVVPQYCLRGEPPFFGVRVVNK